MAMSSSHIRLGDCVEDIVTEFRGIAAYRMESITGVVEIGVLTKIKDGKASPAIYFDIARLRKIDDGIHIDVPERSLGFTAPGGGRDGKTS